MVGLVFLALFAVSSSFEVRDVYTCKTLVTLPQGTRIDVRVTYDNSPNNPGNPSSPPKAVMWGEQTFDEMASVSISMVMVRKEDEKPLQEFVSNRQRAAILRGIQDGTLKRILEQRVK